MIFRVKPLDTLIRKKRNIERFGSHCSDGVSFWAASDVDGIASAAERLLSNLEGPQDCILIEEFVHSVLSREPLSTATCQEESASDVSPGTTRPSSLRSCLGILEKGTCNTCF